jgi:predicted molibdopterin-dependent oxidoreductase YjgC
MDVTINGKLIKTEAGRTILDVCREAGIYIPTLCHDERLEPYGGCRLCVVEVKGVPRPLTACTTPVSDGMVVTTESAALTALRRSVLSLILSDHPNDCMVCEKSGACDLQELAYFYEAKPDGLEGAKRNLPIRDDNPLIYFDPNKCILCGRCVRICHEVVMKGTIDLAGRGFTTIPDTAFSSPKNPDNCVFCGQCISTCPVGALVEKPSMGKGRTLGVKKIKTTCSYCGTGCNFYLNVKGGKVIRVTSDYSAPVNKGNLCIKGRFGYEFIHHEDRIIAPLIREGDAFREASWDEALDLIATKFTELKDKYGPQSVGAFSSSRCTNEENYLMSKWVRAVLGSNNVDNCARV